MRRKKIVLVYFDTWGTLVSVGEIEGMKTGWAMTKCNRSRPLCTIVFCSCVIIDMLFQTYMSVIQL
jgi:hypothetical protein